MKIIETLDQWQILKSALLKKGYSLYQFQYRWDEPEGFHAWFINPDRTVEILTHNKDVEAAIIDYNAEKDRE